MGRDALTTAMASAVGSRWKGIQVADGVELHAVARAIPDKANSLAGLRSGSDILDKSLPNCVYLAHDNIIRTGADFHHQQSH